MHDYLKSFHLLCRGRKISPYPPRLIFLLAFSAIAIIAAGFAFSLLADMTSALPLASSAKTSKFSSLEPGEELSGGEATFRNGTDNANAFSHASGNMPFEDELQFKVGNGIFKKNWVSAPSSTTASDGLGPLFNARSCQSCHIKDGRGHPPPANWPDSDAVSMLFRLSVPAQKSLVNRGGGIGYFKTLPEPTYGSQLQDLSIQGFEPEGKIHIDYEEISVTLNGGETVSLRKPSYSITNLAYGPLDPETMISPRIAPPMIGLGLLEAIPEADILKNADPDDKDGDGISGRPNWAADANNGKPVLGRFGWKATAPSIRQQTAEAFANDIGISNTLIRRPSGDCTERQARCLSAPNGNSPGPHGVEIEDKLFDPVVFYAQNLAVPARRAPGALEILKGKQLFHEIGCAACHIPSFRTGQSPGQPYLSGQVIWPYTDLLLHDMGEGLADNRPDGEASGREWRTAPLWGVGLTQIVNGHTFFLHDGRARNITEAILWHGGEAQRSRDAFAALTREERERLIAFVNSL